MPTSRTSRFHRWSAPVLALALVLGLLSVVGCGSSKADPPLTAAAGASAGGAPSAGASSSGASSSGAVAGSVAGGASAGETALAGAAGAAGASADATLTALVPSVGALVPVFSPKAHTYALRVPHGTASVAVTPTAAAGATLQVNGAPVPSGQASAAFALPSDGSALDLVVGVTAEDGTTKSTYVLHVLVQTPSAGVTIYSVGDSTMADYQLTVYPNQRGWMQLFPKFTTGDVSIKNMGINGTSSKSYYLTASWTSVKNKLNTGDYVFIQFGHNDEKDSGIEGSTGIGTDARGAYHDYLSRYVSEARALGAIPILFTPVVRLGWNGSKLTPTARHDLTGNGVAVGDANYPAAMRDVATQMGCPLVDLTASSQALVESYGPTAAKSVLYISADDTHLQVMGALSYAQLAASGLKSLTSLGAFIDHLNPVLGLESSSSALDFGTRYVGSSLERSVSLDGLSLVPATGKVHIVAPAGFSVGTDTIEPSALLDLPYVLGALPPTTVRVRFQPASATPYAAELGCTPGSGASQSVALSATALATPAGAADAEARYTFDSASSLSCAALGGITCADERLSGLAIKDISPLTTLIPAPLSLPTQRLTIVSAPSAESWPLEADKNSQRYVDFSLDAGAGKQLAIDTVSFYAGNGGPTLAFRALCSTKDDFSSPTELQDTLSNETNVLTFHAFSPLTSVGPSQTFHLRIYPYSTAAASNKYLSLQSVTIHGVRY